MLTVEILQLPVLRSFLSGEHPATELSQFRGYELEVFETSNKFPLRYFVVIDKPV
jgi:hypothetical protein